MFWTIEIWQIWVKIPELNQKNPSKGHIHLKLIFHSVFLITSHNLHHRHLHDGSGDWKGLRRRAEGEPGQLWQLWWLPPNPWLPIILSAGRDKLQGPHYTL